MKFEENNRVKIISIKNGVHREMDDYPKIFLNKIGTINEVDEKWEYTYAIKFDDVGLEEMNTWLWADGNLELFNIEDSEEYKAGYTKGFSDGVIAVTNAKVYEDQSFEDEIGGIHDEGTGWNPYGVWCGECGNLTCVGCPSASKGKNEE